MCILVGPERTPYHLHSEILSSKCPYFRGRADFRANSRPDDQEEISLEDVPCELFDMFVEYIYTAKYTPPTDSGTTRECELYAQLYCFADFLMMDGLKENVLSKMKSLLEGTGWVAPTRLQASDVVRLLEIVYHCTVERQTSADSSWKADRDPDSRDEIIGQASAKSVSKERIPEGSKPEPMQAIVARYAAVQIETLREDEGFDNLITTHTGIARDIIAFLRPAGPF